MCRTFTDFRTAFRQLPSARDRYVRRMPEKSARTSTWLIAKPAEIANAGDASKMNRAAVIAMKTAAKAQTVTRLYAGSLRRGTCHSRYAIAARLTPNVATPNDRMIWDIPGDWSSAMVVTTFVWTKYPAPVKKALARVGFTRTPTPSPTPAAINVLGMTSVQG